jgi:hypothetical protein
MAGVVLQHPGERGRSGNPGQVWIACHAGAQCTVTSCLADVSGVAGSSDRVGAGRLSGPLFLADEDHTCPESGRPITIRCIRARWLRVLRPEWLALVGWSARAPVGHGRSGFQRPAAGTRSGGPGQEYSGRSRRWRCPWRGGIGGATAAYPLLSDFCCPGPGRWEDCSPFSPGARRRLPRHRNREGAHGTFASVECDQTPFFFSKSSAGWRR